MKVLVCGGREFGKVNNENADGSALSGDQINARHKERIFVNHTLDKLDEDRGITKVIEGGASGVDTCAFWWAVMRRKDRKSYPAKWKLHGKKAGSIRNQEMLEMEKPDIVVAFPGGRGTADMVRKARRAGVEVIEVQYDYVDQAVETV